MTRVLALLVGLAISWMVLPAAASAAVTRDDSVHAYPYGASIYGAPESATALERGPPVTGYANTTFHAVDLGSHGASARPSAPRATYDYDDTALLAQRDIVVGATDWPARADTGDLSSLSVSQVAAKPAIGFADDAVGSAYQGMRSGGGHAIRHLRDDGLISNSGSLASQVSQFENLTSPILRSPSATFDWRLGSTLSRGFAGEAGGQQVVVFVAKEGPYQGRVLSAVVSDASQMAQWGLP